MLQMHLRAMENSGVKAEFAQYATAQLPQCRFCITQLLFLNSTPERRECRIDHDLVIEVSTSDLDLGTLIVFSK